MRLSKEILFNKQKENIIIDKKGDTFLLNDPVSIYIFELLLKEQEITKSEILINVQKNFDTTQIDSDKVKQYIYDFLYDLENLGILIKW